MNRLASILKGCLAVLLLAGLAVGLTTIFSQAPPWVQSGQPLSPIQTPPLSPIQTPLPFTRVPTPAFTPAPMETRPPPPPTPALTPEPRTPVGTSLTATSRPGEIRPPVELSPAPTPTPMPVTDLAEGIPDEDKYVFIIQHADGTYEGYVIPVNSQDKRELMGLGPQDTIVGEYPLVPLPPSTPVLTLPARANSPGDLFVSPMPTPIPMLQP